ncbi:MAG: methyltransferase domain-containing protein [Bacteroidales bacterium]|nr:methyltransferase domain-containing protein [Bacteroidales bacterium]
MVETKNQLSRIIENYKLMAPYYDDGANTMAARISDFVTRSNLLHSLSNLQIKSILDAGGGSGQWAVFLAEQGYDVTIMDASPDLLELAQNKILEKNLSIRIIEGNIEQTPFEKNTFDMVFAEGGVISLTPNPNKMLREFNRVLKSGGYIWIDYLNLVGWTLLQTDIKNKLQLIKKEEADLAFNDAGLTFRLFMSKKIRYMLYEAGFLDLKEFGNGILTHPMMKDEELTGINFEKIAEAELKFSRNYNSTGAAFHIQVLAQKIIY